MNYRAKQTKHKTYKTEKGAIGFLKPCMIGKCDLYFILLNFT